MLVVAYLALERLVASPWGRVLRAVREDEAVRETPVIFLTARAGADERSESLEDGADDYECLLLQQRELVAHAGGLLELQVARVLQHLLFQPLDFARQVFFRQGDLLHRRPALRQHLPFTPFSVDAVDQVAQLAGIRRRHAEPTDFLDHGVEDAALCRLGRLVEAPRRFERQSQGLVEMPGGERGVGRGGKAGAFEPPAIVVPRRGRRADDGSQPAGDVQRGRPLPALEHPPRRLKRSLRLASPAHRRPPADAGQKRERDNAGGRLPDGHSDQSVHASRIAGSEKRACPASVPALEWVSKHRSRSPGRPRRHLSLQSLRTTLSGHPPDPRTP